MKALLAWYVVSLSWHSRPMYALLGELNNARAYQGTNIGRTLVDGFLFVLVGVLLFLLPLVGILLFPITSLWLVTMNRKDWRDIQALTRAGRVSWSTGTIKDEPKPEEPQPEAEANHEQ